MRAFGVAGWSGSGKTTLLVRLIPELVGRGFRVSTVKHAHHAFDVDRPGKDSFRHREAGAREVINSQFKRLDLDALRGSLELLGFMKNGAFPEWARYPTEMFSDILVISLPQHRRHTLDVRRVAEQWKLHRMERNYELADDLKNAALEAGIELRARPEGVEADTTRLSFNPAKLEALK